MAESMEYNEQTGRYEKKRSFSEKIKGRFEQAKEARHEDQQFKKKVKEEGKKAERNSYRKGYVKGRAKAGYKKGVKKGQGGGGLVGGFKGAASFFNEHVEIGPKEGGKERSVFDLGFGSGSSHEDLGLGFMSSRPSKGKKKDDWDLGL